MIRWGLLFFCLIFISPLLAQDGYYAEPVYECMSPVMPGEQGVFTSDRPLQAEMSWSSDVLIEAIPQGSTFTVLEGPVCHEEQDDYDAWVKIDYQSQQGWILITEYGLCEVCPDDPPQFWAQKAQKSLEPVTPMSDDPRLAPPLTQRASDALMPDTVTSLVQLQALGEGRLKEVHWIADGSLSLTTSLDWRMYDPQNLAQPVSTVIFEQPISSLINARHRRLIAVPDPQGRLRQIHILDEITGHRLATLEGESALFDEAGRYLAVTFVSETAKEIRLYDMSDIFRLQLVKTLTDVGTPSLFKDGWLITYDEGYYYTVDLETGEMTEFIGGFGTMNFTDGFVNSVPSPDHQWIGTVYNVSFAEIGYRTDDYTFQIYNVSQLPPSPMFGYANVSDPITTPERSAQGTDVVWSADSQQVIVTAENAQYIYRYNREDKYFELVQTLTLSDVTGVAMSSDGTLTAFVTSKPEVLIYQGAEQIAVLSDEAAITSGSQLAFSPDGQTLAISDTGLSLWNMTTFEKISALTLNSFYGFQVSSDGISVKTGNRRYDLATGDLLDGQVDDVPLKQDLIVKSQRDDFRATSFIVTDEATGQVINTFEGYFGEADARDLSPDNRLLAIADYRSPDTPSNIDPGLRMLLFDVQTGDLLNAVLLSSQWGSVNRFVFSPDGKKILFLLRGDEVQWMVYDIRTSKLTAFPGPENTQPQSFVLNYDGTLAFMNDVSGHLAAWNTITGAPIDVPSLAETQGITTLALAADGSRLYTMDQYGRFFVWGLLQ